jgi:hypothetical protein
MIPELNRPRLAALRETAQEELMLRVLTVTSIHMRMAPHPEGPDPAPRHFMGPQHTAECTPKKGDDKERDTDATPPGAEETSEGRKTVDMSIINNGEELLRGFKGIVDAQTARVGDPAAPKDVEVR